MDAPEDGTQPQRHYEPWTATDLATITEAYHAGTQAREIAELVSRTPSAVRQQLHLMGVAQDAPACGHCGSALPVKTGRGRKAKYCSAVCRSHANEAVYSERIHAAVAAGQGPCEHCGTSITPGARAKRFCSKSCSKKAGYAAQRAAAASA